jgi:hypothetical protein
MMVYQALFTQTVNDAKKIADGADFRGLNAGRRQGG